MEDKINGLLDKLMLCRLEEILDLLEGEDTDEENETVYEAAKCLYAYFGGDIDEY